MAGPNPSANFFAATQPDAYARSLNLQQQQALATALMGQVLGPQKRIESTGRYVVPYGLGEGLTHLGKALATRMLQQRLNTEQADLARQSSAGLAGALSPGAGYGAAPASNTATQASLSDGGGPTNENALKQTAYAPTTSTSNPLSLSPDVTGGQAAALYSMDPSAYAGALLDRYKGTDVTKNLQAAGINPRSPEGVSRIQSHINPATNVRPGGAVLPFGATAPSFTNPAAPAGSMNVWGGGSPYPVNAPVPGAFGSMAAGAAAESGGKAFGAAPYQTQTVQTPGAATLQTQQQAIEGATGQPMPLPFGAPGSPAPGAPAAGRGIPLQSEEQRTAQSTMGGGLGKIYNTIQEDDFTSNAKINKFSRLGNLLDGLGTGRFTPTGYELAAAAKGIGVPIGEKLDNAQAAKAISRELALELRNPSGGAGMPGALSDSDRSYLESAIASLDKTPGANKLILESHVKVMQRSQEVAKLARQYKRQHGQFDEGFYDTLQQYSNAHPLFTAPVDYGTLK